VTERRELDLLLRTADAAPTSVAVRLGDRALTYAALRGAAAHEAARLRELGIGPRDVVALLMDNALEFVAGYFAVHWLGAVAMPLNPKEPAERLRYCLEQASARAALVRTLAEVPRMGLDGLPGMAWLPVELDSAGSDERRFAVPPVVSSGEDELALIMFTTGTTGAPKGVKLSHVNTLAAMRGIVAFMGMARAPIEVLPTPLYHSFGLARMRAVLHCAGTLVLERGFLFPARLLDTVAAHRATGFCSVPAGWEILLAAGPERLRERFRSVRYVEIGSAPMSADRKRQLIELLPQARICMHYGLTEASRSIFMEFHAEADNLETLGRPLPGVEVSIRDDHGRPAPDGEEGEICVRGRTVFAGYLGDDSATAAAFFGPWLRTGDLGRRSSDGRFYLSGRLKELINLGGTKVSPIEIERVLNACPGVKESAVIGVVGGAITGEEIHAFVVPGGSELSAESIRAFVANRLEPLRRPAQIHFVAELPKTSSGKLQRLKLGEALGRR
jgi:long-chain acyl-CoA synthetase